jgi:hypothetical protein
VKAAGDIFALGDVHGDYKRLVKVLAAAGVIDDSPDSPADVKWKAGDAVLVCTGDLIDKHDQSLKVIAFFQALSKAAGQDGGRVVVTMGNHEAEFLGSPGGGRKAKVFLKELKDAGITHEQIAACKDKLGLGAFFQTLPVAVCVNDWFFCHGGNTKGLSRRELADGLRKGIETEGYNAQILSVADSLLQARMHPMAWWEREGETPEQGQARLEALVKALGVNHLVFGHQPGKVEFLDGTKRRKGTLFTKYEGLVFMIDVGMSRGVDDSEGAILRIHKQGKAATAILPDGSKTRLWEE